MAKYRTGGGNAHGFMPYNMAENQDPGCAPAIGDDALAACYPYGGNPRCRTRFFGVTLGPVAPLAAALTAPGITPQNPIVPHRLVIPSTIAPFFLITQFVIGSNNMIIAGGGIPAEMFTEVAMDVIVRLDVLDKGTQLIVGVTNIDTVDPHLFTMGVIGTTPDVTGLGG